MRQSLLNPGWQNTAGECDLAPQAFFLPFSRSCEGADPQVPATSLPLLRLIVLLGLAPVSCSVTLLTASMNVFLP